MKKTTLPVALVQERNHGGADDNLAVIEQRVAEAARQGAKLVLLQELHNGPYFCQHESVDQFDLAETDRKSVVSGKGVSVRVDLECRRILKKKTNSTHLT